VELDFEKVNKKGSKETDCTRRLCVKMVKVLVVEDHDRNNQYSMIVHDPLQFAWCLQNVGNLNLQLILKNSPMVRP
jgi:hypothetical protein